MAIFATINDVLEYEPDIQNYGIHDFSDALSKAQSDVERWLRIQWWPTQQIGRFDITIIGTNTEMDPTKLQAAQLKRATVFNALSYYIYPQLSKFEPDLDVFQIKMEYYKTRWSEEIDLVIRDGVEYDLDSDGTVTDIEKQPEYFLRLKR